MTESNLLLEHPDLELKRIRKLVPHLLCELNACLANSDRAFPVLHFKGKNKVIKLQAEEVGESADWFFIGDIHGDFFALHTLLRQAESLRPNCRICFLGDLVDRGDMPFECLFLLLEWGMHRPGHLAWIAGNHDIAFSKNVAGVFESEVNPAELLLVLNRFDIFSSISESLGRFFIEVTRGLPRALLFPDGLLATHGGFPLADHHATGAAMSDEPSYLNWLNSDACLKDFTWTRIHRAPKKLPDRYSTGAQYGFKDFEAFCALKPEWFPIARMITGHEHPKNGFQIHASYLLNPAMTLVGFGFDDMKPMPQAYQSYTDKLYLAQGMLCDLPTVIPVTVMRNELEMLYPGTAIATVESVNPNESESS